MSQKKIFLAVVAVSTVSLLLHHGGHLSWTMEALHLGCPALRSHPSPGLRPKHTNVAFLKTHKTASTTMQNLLFRFGERNNLTVALPVQACVHQFCYPRTFAAHFVHPHTLPANIITSHMRFDRAEVARLMPNDTVYVTIVREPGAMFESLFSYYNQYCQSFKRVPNGSLEAFLEEPWRYYRPDEKDSMYARNTLTFDLGGDKDRPATDAAYARAFVAEVERSFSLVMIAEHFDESLVLLRRLLSWDLDDVLYVKLNMRTPGSKRSLTPAQRPKIRAWNWLDARLYDHFNASLWRKLAALGPACVAREVALLRRAQERLMRGCFGGRMPQLRSAAQIKNKDLRPWQPSAKVDIVGYDLPTANLSGAPGGAGGGGGPGGSPGGSPGGQQQQQELCLKLIMPEVQYTRNLLRSQSLRYRRSYPLRSQQPQSPMMQQTAMRSVLPRHLQVGGAVHHSPPAVAAAAAPPPPPPPGGQGGSTGTTPPQQGARTTHQIRSSLQTQAS